MIRPAVIRALVAMMAGIAASQGGAAPEAREWRDPAGGKLPYRWHEPAQQEPGRKYPLVLFLHGAGERGDNNTAQLRHGVKDILGWAEAHDEPCFLVAPQCPAEIWWAALDRETMNLQTGAKPARPLRRVITLVEELMQKHPVDPARFYVTGLSMGGYGSWSLLATVPEMIAAAVPVCGGGDPATAEQFAQVPVWAFHGARDQVVPPQASRRMVAALQAAGGRPGFTEYPEAGHDSWSATYRDAKVLAWMFAQRRVGDVP